MKIKLVEYDFIHHIAKAIVVDHGQSLVNKNIIYTANLCSDSSCLWCKELKERIRSRLGKDIYGNAVEDKEKDKI